MADLIGVHGIGHHQTGRHALATAWGLSIADGLERAAERRLSPPLVELAFYGDLFLADSEAAPSAAAKSAVDEQVLDGLADDELAEVTDALQDAVTAEDVEAAEREQSKAYSRVPRPLQILLAALDRRFGAAAGVLYVGVLRQVRRYLSDPELKARVDRRVVAAVGEDCRVLVGHSLGSVVAYEYLQGRPDHQVAVLVTLGSPLGLRMVRNRLTVARVPVPTWANVRDLRDPVACAGPLSRWWPQLGPSDEVVVDNGGNAHSVLRYLNRKATGQVLLRALPHWAVP